jgi:hypothetical protein
MGRPFVWQHRVGGDAKALLRTAYGDESLMLLGTKYRAAIAATLMYSLLVSDLSCSSQSPPLTENHAVPASGMNLWQESASCAQEEETAPLSHRVQLVGESCAPLPPAGWANGFCGSRGAAAPGCKNDEARIQMQLLAMGRRGDLLSRVRKQVLEILESKSACSAWYQEVDADSAAAFRSLEFILDEKAAPYVYSIREGRDAQRFKHPWVASSIENAGRNSTIRLNANGAFFNRSSQVFAEAGNGGPGRFGGTHTLLVDSYAGATTEAQVTTMLHELGHILGRLPADSDSWDGQSARNTAEVLRHCRPEIKAMARRSQP